MCGLIVPSFGDISYYFSLNVVQFSKYTVSMLTLLGFVTLLTGTLAFDRCFGKHEVRQLMLWNSCLGVIGSFINLLFAMRLNLAMGISDLTFVVCSSLITDTLSTALS